MSAIETTENIKSINATAPESKETTVLLNVSKSDDNISVSVATLVLDWVKGLFK